MENKNQVGILGVNILYLITALLLLTVGAFVQYRDIITGLIVTEYIIVLLPPILYLKIKGNNLKETLRLNKLTIKQAVLVIGITLLTYIVAMFFNLLVLILLSLKGTISQPPIPTANNFMDYFVLMMIIAVSAGICEEVFFRGMLMRGYERFGARKAIIMSSILFGLFHFNLQNFAGPTILGFVFGYLVYKTNSLYAGMIGHITNNGLAVTLGFLGNWVSRKFTGQSAKAFQQMPSTIELIASAFIIALFAIAASIGAWVLLKKLRRETERIAALKEEYQQKEEIQEEIREEIQEDIDTKVSWWVFIPIALSVALFLLVGYMQIIEIV